MSEENKIHEQTDQAVDLQEQDNLKTLNQKKDTETTFEDVLLDIEKRAKDKEAFEKLKTAYEKQFAGTVSKKKIEDIKVSLLEEYADIRADLKAEKLLSEKMEAKMQEYELEEKSFLEKNGLSVLTDEERDEALAYGGVKDETDTALAKSNPFIAKKIREATEWNKARSKPLPTNTVRAEVTPDELEKLQAQKEALLDKKRNKASWKPSDAVDLDTITNKIVFTKRELTKLNK
jgi:hypothetical protein